MNLKEAYSILKIPSTSTPEETKKQYKKLTKEFHPDVNKSPGSEDKFKKINEAYSVIQESGDQNLQPDWNPFSAQRPFSNPFSNPFGKNNRQFFTANIDVQTSLSFKDAVQGCKVDLKYARQVKCSHCDGSGEATINNGCAACGGRGQATRRQGNAIFVNTCTSCLGKVMSVACLECNSIGVVEAETSVNVVVPPAVVDGNTLVLKGMGNYTSSIMGMVDTYTDAHLHIKVVPEPGLRLVDRDVVSELNISLLNSFQGCTKTTHTLDGDKEIQVPAGIKNKEEIVIKVGDKKSIKQRIIVLVGYPTDFSKLIDVLTKEGR